MTTEGVRDGGPATDAARPLPDPAPAGRAPLRPVTRRRTELLLVAVVAAAVAAAGWHRRWTSDDAFITIRVVS